MSFPRWAVHSGAVDILRTCRHPRRGISLIPRARRSVDTDMGSNAGSRVSHRGSLRWLLVVGPATRGLNRDYGAGVHAVGARARVDRRSPVAPNIMKSSTCDL